jgi:GT2 family glycosyltransferase
VTNNIGNEARVPVSYTDLADMPVEALRITSQQLGRTFDIASLAFFCVMLPREVYEQVGGLDEHFRMGFFEDDDYCHRVRAVGRRVVCAEDVFIHHELSASFGKLANEERLRLFVENRQYFESKWGPWSPHQYRKKAA